MLEMLIGRFDDWLRAYDAWYQSSEGCAPSEDLRGWQMGIWYNEAKEWIVGTLWEGEAEEPLGEGETLLIALLNAALRIEAMRAATVTIRAIRDDDAATAPDEEG